MIFARKIQFAVWLGIAAWAHASEVRFYRVPTSAMQPTIPQGSIVEVILDESYRSNIARFDIVAYKPSIAGFGGQIYLKRVLALSGEKVEITASGVKINNEPVTLPVEMNLEGLGLKPVSMVIPVDSVFLIGDYTKDSLDSRYLGPRPTSEIIGRYIKLKK